MIYPTEEDIGRSVLYTGERFRGKSEEGSLKALSRMADAVFVRYGNNANATLTYNSDLEWTYPRESDVMGDEQPPSAAGTKEET